MMREQPSIVQVYEVSLFSDGEDDDVFEKPKRQPRLNSEYLKVSAALLSKPDPRQDRQQAKNRKRDSLGLDIPAPQTYMIDFAKDAQLTMTNARGLSAHRLAFLSQPKQTVVPQQAEPVTVKPKAMPRPLSVPRRILPAAQVMAKEPSLRKVVLEKSIRNSKQALLNLRQAEIQSPVTHKKMMQPDGDKGIRVILRCCPSKNEGQCLEIKSDTEVEISGADNADLDSSCISPSGDHGYVFDKILRSDCSQETAFEETRPVLERFLKDKTSGAIIAYGQTATGKTHTMGLLPASLNEAGLGIVPRAITRIFREMKSVDITALELYLDQVRDLMTDPEEASLECENSHLDLNGSALNIREKQGKAYVHGLKQVTCSSAKECWGVIREAAERRERKETDMNKVSSRSHLIITLTATHGGGSTLSFVDLAGSERITRTQADVKEVAFINTSLAALGNVVRALSTSASFVPFRDSKLTRLLQTSLVEGNAVLFATVSLERKNATETLSTLKFAERCSRVVITTRMIAASADPIKKRDFRYVELLKIVKELSGEEETEDDGSDERFHEMISKARLVLKRRAAVLDASFKSLPEQSMNNREMSAIPHEKWMPCGGTNVPSFLPNQWSDEESSTKELTSTVNETNFVSNVQDEPLSLIREERNISSIVWARDESVDHPLSLMDEEPNISGVKWMRDESLDRAMSILQEHSMIPRIKWAGEERLDQSMSILQEQSMIPGIKWAGEESLDQSVSILQEQSMIPGIKWAGEESLDQPVSILQEQSILPAIKWTGEDTPDQPISILQEQSVLPDIKWAEEEVADEPTIMLHETTEGMTIRWIKDDEPLSELQETTVILGIEEEKKAEQPLSIMQEISLLDCTNVDEADDLDLL